MRLIYRKDGLMANSQFDPSLLDPIDQKSDGFDTSQLQSVDEKEQDPGSYLDKLPGEEGFFHKLPRNIVIGLAKLGHSTLNLPHDLTEIAEKRLSDLSNNMKNKDLNLPKYKNLKISDYIPKQDNYDFANLMGQKGDPTLMDKLIQGGVQYFPEMASGRALLSEGLGTLMGTRQLNKVAKAAGESGLNFNLPSEAIEEAKNYLPKTHATREMINASEAGSYPSSFSLQSQLGKHQRDLSTSPLAAERLLAPKVSELRQGMQAHLANVLESNGMSEEANLLRQGINNYRQYMQVKNAAMPIIKKLGIPTTIAAGIGFGYKKGKSFVNQ